MRRRPWCPARALSGRSRTFASRSPHPGCIFLCFLRTGPEATCGQGLTVATRWVDYGHSTQTVALRLRPRGSNERDERRDDGPHDWGSCASRETTGLKCFAQEIKITNRFGKERKDSAARIQALSGEGNHCCGNRILIGWLSRAIQDPLS